MVKTHEQHTVAGYKNLATQYLNRIRDGKTSFGHYHDQMQKALKAGGLSLADIGTTEEEIETLRVANAHKTEAIQWFNSIYSGQASYYTARSGIDEALKAGGLSLADIGTNEEELEALRPRN